MSPYFTKYGRSRRFHEEFSLAQSTARQEQLGIWDPAKEHYGDYDERLAWWEVREKAITEFEDGASDRDEFQELEATARSGRRGLWGYCSPLPPCAQR